jgi:nucleotide-binding universal stress UspA family protein
MFSKVIAGIDGTRASLEAGRQAAQLVAPGGELVLLAAADPYLTMFNRWGTERLVQPDEARTAEVLTLAKARIGQRAEESLRAMREQLPDTLRVSLRIEGGRGWDVLRDVADAEGAELLAIGSHGGTRLAGIALGSTATELLHDAPCSVLIARTPYNPARFPSSLVVGVDGSACSLAALDLAKALVANAGNAVSAVAIAARGSDLTEESLNRLARPLRTAILTGRPVEALVEAAASVDLVLVGARGLAGARALGSVSERVAHRAESSVLVVQGPR